MASLMPETPGRGRSRFSKALPLPPDAAPDLSNSSKSPALSTATTTTSTHLHSPLPAIPPAKLSLPPIVKAVPRRPLGMTAEQRALSEALARAANSPLHSSSAASISRSTSENSTSTMDSISTRESSVADTTLPTPPIPPKDNQRQVTKTPEPAPETAAVFPLQTPSPPRPEIWRRRSLKSDVSVTDLKLDRSNGSTASPPRQGPPKGALPQLPRSNTSTYNTSSGNFNRKPVPVRPAPPQPEQMGSKISKIKEKTAATTRNPFHSPSSSKDEPAYRSTNRPPTPESVDGLQETEEYARIRPVPDIKSPRSPDTPPEETLPRIPPRSDSRFALANRAQPSLPVAPLLSQVNNDSNSTLRAPETTHSRQSSATLTVTSPDAQTQPPDVSRLLEPSAIDDNDLKSSPLTLPSPVDETRSPPPGASVYFPRMSSTPLPEDTVLPGMPLSITHYECYQSHRLMRSTRNVVCPVACMVCDKRDKELRWKCSWCCLNACATCMQVLTQVPGKDLKVAIEMVRG